MSSDSEEMERDTEATVLVVGHVSIGTQAKAQMISSLANANVTLRKTKKFNYLCYSNIKV